MINNNKIQNTKTNFPAIEGLSEAAVLGKIRIKNIYQPWRGENINQIRERSETNPYNLRVGMPGTDEGLKNDSVYFIFDYLSYNPLSKLIEKRQLTPLRNMEKIYIGQSIDENAYSSCKLNIEGSAVMSDLYFKDHATLEHKSIADTISELINTVQELKLEIINLKQQVASQQPPAYL